MQRRRLGVRDQSTMSEKEFLIEHILCCTAVLFGMDWLLQIIVPGDSYRGTLPSSFGCTIVANLAIVVNYRYHRRKVVIAQDALIGTGLYIMQALNDSLPFACILLIRGLLGGMLGVSVYGFARILSRKINRENAVSAVLLRRIFSCIRLLHRNAAITAAIVIVLAPIGTRFFYDTRPAEGYDESIDTVQNGENLKISASYDDSYQLSENLDTIKLIRDNETFQSLDYEKKLDVLRAITYCEARYLGLCKINVEFIDMDNDDLLGSYNYTTKTLSINKKPIQDGTLPGGSSDELLRTVLHECRHVYQILLADCYYGISPSQRSLHAFSDVGEWIENLKDYKSGDGTVDEQIEYQSQAIEQDAEEYSRREAFRYYWSIDDLLKEQELAEDEQEM